MTKHVQHHLFELLPIYALAVEHAATLAGHELDFQKLFITQEEGDEELASLADMLEVLVKKWPDQFTASDVAGMINNLPTKMRARCDFYSRQKE